jgi:hypothetical protein
MSNHEDIPQEANDLSSEIFHGLTSGETDQEKIESGAKLILRFALHVACVAVRN